MVKSPDSVSKVNLQDIWRALDDVVDPEIPVVSLIEMGIIRDVTEEKGRIVIRMTPTFAGCPALEVMESDIRARLEVMDIVSVDVVRVLDPPWTSDWISKSAREKIKQIGLAPPHVHGGDFIAVLDAPVTCPYCDSFNTTLKNSFGSTPCRMIYYCNNCTQPFEQFKPL